MVRLPVILALVFFSVAGSASAQATRTWVASVTGAAPGSDANPCSRTAPCQTFAGAMSKTFIAGEINAVDSGGFGTVTVPKSITIDGAGAHASLLASGTDGVNVDLDPANANDPLQRVVLRNLAINGTGSSGTVGTNTGLRGVDILNARTVVLENVTIQNFAVAGINFVPEAGSPEEMTLILDNVRVLDGSSLGIRVLGQTPTQKLNVLIRNSVFSGHRGDAGTDGDTGAAITADSGAAVSLVNSAIFGNRISVKILNSKGTPGIVGAGCGTFIANNRLIRDTPESICPPVIQTNTVNTQTQLPGETKTVTVKEPVQCEVPNLKGVTTAIAKRLLKAARCALGTTTRKKASKRSQVGRVTAQSRRAGTLLPAQSKVNVTVGRR